MNVNPIELTDIDEKRRGLWYRLKRLVVFGIRQRLFGHKFFLLVFVFFTFIPALFVSGLIYFASTNVNTVFSFLGNGGTGGGTGSLTIKAVYLNIMYYAILLTALGEWTLLAVLFGSMELFCDEFRAHTFKYYFAQPVPHHFYLTGRFLTLVLSFYPLISFPFLIGVGIPLATFKPIAEAFTFLELTSLLLGGLFAIFLILTFQIMMVFAFSTFWEKKFVFLGVLLLYFTTWITPQLLLPRASEAWALTSFYYYLQSFVIIFLSLLWYGENLIRFPFITREPHLTYLAGMLGGIFLMIFTLITLWRLKLIEE